MSLNKHEPLPRSIYLNIRNNTLGLIGSKVGDVSLNATDNIIISAFIGISWVGIYSNYLLIINSISNLIIQFLNSVSASIGNFVIDKSNQHEEQFVLLKRHLFVTFTITFFCSSLLSALINPFITIWAGYQYNLNTITVFLIILNFELNSMRQTPITFITAYGLFKKVGIKSILEAILNIGFSLVFVVLFKLGINGVLLGTLSSNLLLNIWYEPYVVMYYGVNNGIKSLLNFYIWYIYYLGVVILITGIITTCSYFIVLQNNILLLLIRLFTVLIFSLFSFYLLSFKSKEYKYFKTIFFRYLSLKKTSK